MQRKRSKQRSVLRRGDFTVLEEDFEAAEEAFETRSKGSQTRDKATRAPIAPDLGTWKRNQRGLDYPGIDTPTDRPRHAFFDAPLPGDTAMDDGIGLSEEGGGDHIMEMREEHDSAMDNMAEAVEDLFKL